MQERVNPARKDTAKTVAVDWVREQKPKTPFHSSSASPSRRVLLLTPFTPNHSDAGSSSVISTDESCLWYLLYGPTILSEKYLITAVDFRSQPALGALLTGHETYINYYGISASGETVCIVLANTCSTLLVICQVVSHFVNIQSFRLPDKLIRPVPWWM